MKKYIPNAITILRFCLIPCVCYAMLYCDFSQNFLLNISVLIFIIAAISDFLDGFLARKLKAESDFGKFFDNIADKLLSISVICILIKLDRVWLLPALVVILREVLIASLREYMAITKGRKIDVEFFGKVKTTCQFISLPILMQYKLEPYFNANELFVFGNIVFVISAIASVASGISYLSVFLRNNGKSNDYKRGL